mmetsp:Transcript_118678/g.329842  ORF Transcript_118678/g.329842 Transcript_118678/m.329842 type:complete len:238 (+) Transcript_118678:132-845(+)
MDEGAAPSLFNLESPCSRDADGVEHGYHLALYAAGGFEVPPCLAMRCLLVLLEGRLVLVALVEDEPVLLLPASEDVEAHAPWVGVTASRTSRIQLRGSEEVLHVGGLDHDVNQCDEANGAGCHSALVVGPLAGHRGSGEPVDRLLLDTAAGLEIRPSPKMAGVLVLCDTLLIGEALVKQESFRHVLALQYIEAHHAGVQRPVAAALRILLHHLEELIDPVRLDVHKYKERQCRGRSR